MTTGGIILSLSVCLHGARSAHRCDCGQFRDGLVTVTELKLKQTKVITVTKIPVFLPFLNIPTCLVY